MTISHFTYLFIMTVLEKYDPSGLIFAVLPSYNNQQIVFHKVTA